MRFSYSKVENFKGCPFRYKLTYLDGLKPYPSNDPADARTVGTAMHTAIEEGLDRALEFYYGAYPVITDKHIDEAIKIEEVWKKAKTVLPDGEYERKIEIKTPFYEFIGYADMLVKVDDDLYDLYDFKYSNNVDRYLTSGQLSIYKAMLERTGVKVRDMYFVFLPKVQIRQKKTESLEAFRLRLKEELVSKEIVIKKVDYDPSKVVDWEFGTQIIASCKDFPKNVTRLCDWCDYKRYCESDGKDDSDIMEIDKMQLPTVKRRNIEKISGKRIWLYGAPFSGKTYLANSFPNPLMLNTDGNVRFVDSPFVAIKDVVTTEGRLTKRTYAWEVLKETVTELEKGGNDFQTIVIDLVEDCYEYCRVFMFNKLGIEHESDSSFGKGWDMIKTEFLGLMKRITNLDYPNVILISHEDMTKDLTKKSGDKITVIKPNLSEKPALKIAGMVDLVARVVNDGGVRSLSFKPNEFVFGGGRLDLKNTVDVPCTYEALCEIYARANVGKVLDTASGEPVKADTPQKAETVSTPIVETAISEPKDVTGTVEPVKDETATSEPVVEPVVVPTRKRRTRKD